MRNPEYQFTDASIEALEARLVQDYENFSGAAVQPGSPERVIIQWVASILTHERALMNYIGNQNLPSRAEGENLDALAELMYLPKRPQAAAAVCTQRFHISEPQQSAILVPKGTRVTSSGGPIWETVEDVYVNIGDSYTDAQARCQTTGAVGNGYMPGQLNTLIDIYDYYSKTENITASDGGADAATDDEFYELMRASMDAYSCAGARGSYEYFARQVSTEIADVTANSPTPGVVKLYVLMSDGTLATDEIKAAVLAACNADTVRPLTDQVFVEDAEQVGYNIDFTYYTQNGSGKSAVEIQAAVDKAVREYIHWQDTRLGRDINPDELRERLYHTGIKRVELREPVFTRLINDSLSVPQVGQAGLLMRWAALQALTVGAAFLARARGKNPDILRHTGTLIRGRLPPNRQVPAMAALLLALRAAQRYGARGALLARLKGENQQKARLCRLLLGPYTVDVMGLEAARFDGVEEMKTDTYYKLADYSDWGQIVQGAIMREQTPLGLEATLSSIEATIVCRNMAGNSYGTCSNGVNSNGSDSNGICSNGVCSNGNNSDGTCSKGTKTNGTCSNGTCTNGSKSNGTKSYGTNSNGSYSDGTNSNGTCSNGSNTKGTKANGTDSFTKKSYGTNWNGTCSNGTQSNGKLWEGTNSDSSCSNAGNSQTTKQNGACIQGYKSNGANSHTNHSNGTESHGTCSNGSNTDGSQSNGSNTNGIKANGTKSNGSDSYGKYSNGTNSNSANSDGVNSDGAHSEGANSDGVCSHGTKSNENNAHGTHSNGTNSNGKNSDGSEIDAGNSNSAHNN